MTSDHLNSDADFKSRFEKASGDGLTPSQPGLPHVFSHSTLGLDFQLGRALGAAPYGGSDIGECFATARKVRDNDLESWAAEWLAAGARVEDIASDCLAKGHLVSAREAYLRACTYYRTAEFFLSHEDSRHERAWTRSRGCFQEAAALTEPAIVPLQIPYQDAWLPGYFIPATLGVGPRPTLLVMGGWDTTGEELYFVGGGAAAARRGWNAVLFEGPGQRGTVHLHPHLLYRHDYEVPVAAVVDHALTLPNVDPGRIALFGLSMGGYFVLRAAAFEHRLAAVISNTPLADVRLYLMAMGGLPPQIAPMPDADQRADWSRIEVQWAASEAKWRMGANSLAEWFELLRPYHLGEVVTSIRCPTLCLATEGEGQLLYDFMIKPVYDALQCPKTLHVFKLAEGADAHCEANATSRMHQVVFDWLDQTLHNA